MPYISRKERGRYQELVSQLAAVISEDKIVRPGQINYVVSLLLDRVYGSKMRYSDHNEVIGVLECIKQEFYRRKTSPYEDQKIFSEGDLTEI